MLIALANVLGDRALVAKRTVTLDRPVVDWVIDLMPEDGIEEATPGPAVAVGAAALTGMHGDPADRLLVSTAMAPRVPLVTKDRVLHAYAAESDVFDVVW